MLSLLCLFHTTLERVEGGRGSLRRSRAGEGPSAGWIVIREGLGNSNLSPSIRRILTNWFLSLSSFILKSVGWRLPVPCRKPVPVKMEMRIWLPVVRLRLGHLHPFPHPKVQTRLNGAAPCRRGGLPSGARNAHRRSSLISRVELRWLILIRKW